jgi:hypothetical protein
MLVQSTDAAASAVLPSKILRRLNVFIPAFSFRLFSVLTAFSSMLSYRLRFVRHQNGLT